ncbi:MAG: glutamine--fructose-6-phosphate transaminase (isomerizing) [Elusimicrobia bacterium]|nr:glutamine--fructose-6-phosphate transaminase (isomerizing) [Elusimicrobiota bacterium]
MSGIVAYTGSSEAAEILIEGLSRLEYRGYDSVGIAVLGPSGKIVRKRCSDKSRRLRDLLQDGVPPGNTAIGHTRWATHGRPSNENAHPHTSCDGKIAVVHNGIIENYRDLKEDLIEKGHKFTSETDTEVIAHLMEDMLKKTSDLREALALTKKKLVGSYAIALISADHPGEIVAAIKNSPLIIGISDEGNFIVSDLPAILPYTKKVIFLEDGDTAHLTPDKLKIYEESGSKIERKIETISWSPLLAEKQGYKHFMLKEIFEQQRAVQETLMGRLQVEKGQVVFENFKPDPEKIKNIKRIVLIGCGTAYHACLVGKFLIEDFIKIPCEADIASEFRYRKPLINKETFVIAISQSGETADTLAALREAAALGAYTGAICNVIDSSLAREADEIIYTHAGPEISIASTKVFTSQLTALYLLMLRLGNITGSIKPEEAIKISEELIRLPLKIKQILDSQQDRIEEISKKHFKQKNFLFLGRNINYPIALEGALKLKETSYIHAEGSPAGELKHGPIALVDSELPVVIISTEGCVYDKVASTIEEVLTREGRVILLATQGDERVLQFTEDIIWIPPTLELFTPLLNVVPLQLLSYHIARLLGCDIDQPRNLTKAVTVE